MHTINASANNTLQKLVDSYFDLKAKLEPLEKEYEQVKDLIKQEYKDFDWDSITEDTLEIITPKNDRVQISNITSFRFDTTSFKKQHEELYKSFTKPSKSTRLVIAKPISQTQE